MSIAEEDEGKRYGWRQPRPLRYGLFPQSRPFHAGVFALLFAPAIGTIMLVVAVVLPGSQFTRPDVPSLAATTLLFGLWAYVFFMLPALVAGCLYGAWWRRAPNTIAALAGAPVIGFAVTGTFATVMDLIMPGGFWDVAESGAIGAAAGTGCAVWLEYLWRHPLDASTPWRRRKGVWAGLIALGAVLVAALWLTLFY